MKKFVILWKICEFSRIKFDFFSSNITTKGKIMFVLYDSRYFELNLWIMNIASYNYCNLQYSLFPSQLQNTLNLFSYIDAMLLNSMASM